MTSLGIDNTGDLVFPYGKEDTDFYDDTNSKEVFRVSNSRFFCKIRDLFTKELETMYTNRESVQAWNAESLIKQWDDAQGQFPEEIWRLDYERKYKRPYLGIPVDNSIPMGVDKGYLIGKFFGRKKYQRRMYERNQEIYFATKYFANKAKNDRIYFRGNTAPAGSTIKQNYSLTITPYSDMYVCVQYTSTGSPIHKRMKAGEPCTFTSDATSMDFMYIYAASYIQEIGDLSLCYIDDNSFTNGIRLRKLTIGNAEEGYDNPYMKILAADNNPLLEYIDLRNISGLNSDLVLSSCSNLKELYAEGTNASGAIFANGGLLEVAHLPAVKSLLMKNLNYIRDLQIAGYYNLETLTVENCLNVDSSTMVDAADKLQTLRLIGINWVLNDNGILERAYLMWGLDSSNNPSDHSVLAGVVSLPTIMQYDRIKYKEIWTDLTINATEIKQIPVYFKNYDGQIIDTQYVQEGQKPVDSITAGRIDTPVKPSDAQYNYSYTGWDPSTFSNVAVGGTYIYTAQFEPEIRKYTVKYVQPPEFNISTPLQEIVDIEYGQYAAYTEPTPVYTVPEDQGAFTFYLFTGWDKTGYVDGDKVITAQYDKCTYTDGYFESLELNEMRPVELYMLTRLIAKGQITLKQNSDGSNYIGVNSTNIETLDEFNFNMGYDVDVSSVESELLISETKTFSGTISDYYDTGISLFDEDRSFVLAVDYEFLSGNNNGATLMQCFNQGTSDGFKLHYNQSQPSITWCNSSAVQCASGYNREMIVIRHKAGEKGAYVYTSNLSGDEVGFIDFSESGIRIPSTTSDATLIFGCNKIISETIEYGNAAKGKVHWAKVWYDDLGEYMCKELASYIHEEVKTNLCGFRRYYLAGSTVTRPPFSFLASRTLYSKRSMNGTGTGNNTGGWAAMELNSWLNTRFYNGLPLGMKQLIKKVTVYSTAGNLSTELSSSDGYIYIPAVADVNSSANSTLMSEIEQTNATTITYMGNKADRVRIDHTDTAVDYWTRSPNLTNKSYFQFVEADGDVGTVKGMYENLGVVIMFSI